ncbi:putative transcriptional regulator protein, LacI family [Citreicella sp. SE45]|nr:putative transcriptional regulator protein, LacI family [Citreicella sp. SE45]
MGFDTVLRADFPHLTALLSVETCGDPVRTRMVIAYSYANPPDIVGASLMSSEGRQALDTLCDAGGR